MKDNNNKNKVGKLGVINSTGKIGSSAFMFDNTDPAFWKNIEKGIKTSVRVVVKNGYKTYSSCQGHNGTEYNKRTLTVILMNDEIANWINYINALNLLFLKTHPITYILIPKQNNITNMMIKFGNVENLKDT